MAKKVALINMKGGVGKSTLTVQLAWAMATGAWGKKVLVIDLDPQFNCSQYFLGVRRIEQLLRGATPQPTVWNIFEQFTAVPGRPSNPFDPHDALVNVHSGISRGSGCIDLIPSQLELSFTLRDPAGKERLLKQAVDMLEDDYDLVLIDCAPTDSMLTTAAYLVVDFVLIPVRPEYLSTIGLPLLGQSLQNFGTQHHGAGPHVLGIVFNAVSNYSPEEMTSMSEVRQVARRIGWDVFEQRLAYSRSYPKSAREGTSLSRTTYTRGTTKRNFQQLASEFATKVGL